MRGCAGGGASHNICTNSVRTLEPSNNNQLSISQELSDTYPVEKDPKENPYFVRVKEKGKKKAPKQPKGTANPAVLLPLIDAAPLAAPVKEALRGWLAYKSERGEGYVKSGFGKFLTQVKNNVNQYGEEAVVEVIDVSESRNYAGICWEMLQEHSSAITTLQLKTVRPEVKRPDPEIEWRKSRFAPPDYSAGLRSLSTSELREHPKNSGKYVPYWMIPGYMQEYPAGSGKYVPYYDLPGYDPEHDENHWW